jgi:hypothetical protein
MNSCSRTLLAVRDSLIVATAALVIAGAAARA